MLLTLNKPMKKTVSSRSIPDSDETLAVENPMSILYETILDALT